jgi:hypothetical protein
MGQKWAATLEGNGKGGWMSTWNFGFLAPVMKVALLLVPEWGLASARRLTVCFFPLAALISPLPANLGIAYGAESLETPLAARREFEAALAAMVTARLDAGDTQGAAFLNQWKIPGRPDRNVLFVPGGLEPMTDGGELAELPAWRNDFRQLCQQHAERLWNDLRARKKQEDIVDFFAVACQILFYDPDHKGARIILGEDGKRGAQLAVQCGSEMSSSEKSAGRSPRKARNPHPSLGWRAGTYWQIRTPHFVVTSQINPNALGPIPSELERILLVWRQIFASSWLSEKEISQLMMGQKLRRENTRHEVVIFGSRSEYMRYLKEKEPQVEITLGMYRSMDRRSYFFGDPQLSMDTLRHEITHQLFQEQSPARISAGDDKEFWLIEGVALYMESLSHHPRYSTVGGWDSPRLQHARYRALLAGSHLPFVELDKMGRATMQQHPDIRGIYSQAAGMMHFLMDHDQGRYRPWLREKLRGVYGLDPIQLTPSIRAPPAAEMDAQYMADFLPVHDRDLEQLYGDEVPRKLCLGRSPIRSESLEHLSRCDLSQLLWLDLTECQLSAESMKWLSSASSLEQLNLQGTAFNDTMMSFLECSKSLRELDLSRTSIANGGLKHLASFSELEVLWLSDTLVSDEGLVALHELKKLRLLGIGGTQITATGKSQVLTGRPGLRLED